MTQKHSPDPRKISASLSSDPGMSTLVHPDPYLQVSEW